MKKIFLVIVVAMTAIAANAQKFALLDMEYILKNIPAYERANEQLNQVSKKWQAEVEAINTEAQTMYKNYQNEVAFLSNEQKKAKQDAIMKKEQEASELKRKYFGPEGELFKKRSSLMSPIQDEIYNVVRDIADLRGYQLVLDRASDSGIIFGSPKIDISDEVLSKLGYKKQKIGIILYIGKNNIRNNNLKIKNNKTMKKVLIMILMLAPLAAMAQKFGHVNSQEVIQAMPEYTKAKTEIDALQQQYEADLKGMQDEFTKKVKDYEANANTLPENIKQRRETELQEMDQKIRQSYQDNQQALAKASQEKMQVITTKVIDAIKAVGQAGGYVYIMDNASGIPYISPTLSTDVTAQVKAKLGIK